MDIPVIFSAAMIRALRREVEAPGQGKSQTRRLAWRQKRNRADPDADPVTVRTRWQGVRAGDRLWVRETFCYNEVSADPVVFWKADGYTKYPSLEKLAWKSPRAMLKKLSRLTLLVTAVKIEPLHAISEADALAKGVMRTTMGEIRASLTEPNDLPDSMPLFAAPDDDSDDCCQFTAVAAFERLWNIVHHGSVYGPSDESPADWDNNPAVVAVTFRPGLQNIESLAREALAA